MNYCCDCGANVSFVVPENDNRPRYICDSCHAIHYQNPKPVCGCLPVWEDRVLLCKRAIEPRYGYWTLPAGFMENSETIQQAAIRETWEEATAEVEIQQLYCVFSLPHVSQIYMMFLTKLKHCSFKPGAESLETALFRQDEIPWDELAFTTIQYTLEFYFAERVKQNYTTHIGDIIKQQDGFAYQGLK